MNSVYGALYDIVEQRLHEYDKAMPSSKNVFLYAVDKEPGVLDGTQIREMKNDMFMEAAYMGLLNRLPDESAKKSWECNMQLEPEIFRTQLLDTLIFSQEAIVKGACFRNNQVVPVKQRELMAFQAFVTTRDIAAETDNKKDFKDHLYDIYLKLPLSMRMFLRKILRRDSK